MARICVYCGSSPGLRPAYTSAAEDLGEYLGSQGHELVYGGGHVGLMGSVADAALKAGGRVIGVMPEHLVAKEIAHEGLTELIVTKTMHERKQRMAELADGFIALPGGTGTLEEIVEVFVWGQLGLHQNPCGFLDVDGYYSHFLKFLDGMAEERFLREDHLRQLLVGTVAGELVERVLSNRFEAIDKWLDREG